MSKAAAVTPREQTSFDRIADRSFQVGIIGLGYVGLPLARTFARNGFTCTGFDIDPGKIEKLNGGVSYIRHLDAKVFSDFIADGRFTPTTDFSRIDAVDACIICVPTPLNRYREPDLSYVVQTCETIAEHLRPGQLVVLESTTYPGTIKDVVQPILERGGLKAGTDFFLAFSPEREDPGNESFETATIPKVVGADDAESLALASALYKEVVSRVVPVSTAATAEAVKITENIFRAVNIALVNELKVIYAAMGIDVWEVIEAAKTKPFGFMAFYPGPGLGGHCIPIDPFYLTWKAREYGLHTRFIELAGEINTAMPAVVVQRLAEALDQQQPHRPQRRQGPGPRHRLQEERRRHAREPGPEADRAAQGARRRGDVPRPVRARDPADARASRVHGHALGRAHRDGSARGRRRADRHRSRQGRLQLRRPACAARGRHAQRHQGGPGPQENREELATADLVEPFTPASLAMRSGRPLFLYLGRRGALSAFTLELARAAGERAVFCISRQNELHDEIVAAGAPVVSVDTFETHLGAILRLPRLARAAKAPRRGHRGARHWHGRGADAACVDAAPQPEPLARRALCSGRP